MQRVIDDSTKLAEVKQAHEERLVELGKTMGADKLKLLLEQFGSELQDRQQFSATSQLNEIVLDLPLLASTARTFGFNNLASVADRLWSEMLKLDLSETAKSPTVGEIQEHKLKSIAPAMASLTQEVAVVSSLVQAYISENLTPSFSENP